MTAEEGEKNFPRDEEPFLDDEKNRKAVYTPATQRQSLHILPIFFIIDKRLFVAREIFLAFFCSLYRKYT